MWTTRLLFGDPVQDDGGLKCNTHRFQMPDIKTPSSTNSGATDTGKRWRRKCEGVWVWHSHVNWGGKWGRHYHTVWHISFSTPCWGICHFASEGFPVRDEASRWAHAPHRAAFCMRWAIMDVKYHHKKHTVIVVVTHVVVVWGRKIKTICGGSWGGKKKQQQSKW